MSDLDRYFEEFGSSLLDAQRPRWHRRRRGAVAAAVGVGAVTVSVGIAIAANVIGFRTEIGPSGVRTEIGPVSTGPFYAPHAVSAKALVATGNTSRGPYSLRAFTDDRGDVCLELTQGTSLTGACGHPPSTQHPIGATIADNSTRRRDRLLVGVAAENVARVDLRTATLHTAVATQAHLDRGDHVFVIVLPPGPGQDTVLTATDRTGHSLYRTKLRAARG